MQWSAVRTVFRASKNVFEPMLTSGTGNITSNVAMDDVWAPDTISDSADAASGILVYASRGVAVSGNTVGNTQFGIAFVSDPTFGPADGGTVTGNRVAATHIFDGIELCGSSNTIQSNRINGSDESAIHVDSSCGPVTNNVISGNTIVEACAGILVGTAAGPSEFSASQSEPEIGASCCEIPRVRNV